MNAKGALLVATSKGCGCIAYLLSSRCGAGIDVGVCVCEGGEGGGRGGAGAAGLEERWRKG